MKAEFYKVKDETYTAFNHIIVVNSSIIYFHPNKTGTGYSELTYDMKEKIERDYTFICDAEIDWEYNDRLPVLDIVKMGIPELFI